ncbi:uncharacterized protein MEPE_06723 [Melanopsichium pennsylvanicum]|uniref:Uncharacterized protein n=2 Tax=Melanopsichium pennsylvanicum TaxID=63383 RepID=A0AAJ4XT68_9BASI|nr:hypothetical protein BN887_04389 [Melanopsichium pennsylvanicum 4]SNX88012.1 uncharacterized protein MEPE_06723 [Melanopsichium pennsylvanicum]
MRPANDSFLKRLLLLLTLLIFPSLTLGVQDDQLDLNNNLESLSSTPRSPVNVPLRDTLVTSRTIYPDEDPGAARVAWFREMNDQRLNSQGKWRYIHEPLTHPSDKYIHEPASNHAPASQRKPAGAGVGFEQGSRDGLFTFTAGSTMKDTGTVQKGEDNYRARSFGNADSRDGESSDVARLRSGLGDTSVQKWPEPTTVRMDDDLPMSPQGGSSGRRRGRFNEGSIHRNTHSSSSFRHDSDFGVPRNSPSPPESRGSQIRLADVAPFGTDHDIDPGRSAAGSVGRGRGLYAVGGEMREQSPTRNVLDNAAFKLRALQLGRNTPRSSANSPTISSESSFGGKWGITHIRTPLTAPATGRWAHSAVNSPSNLNTPGFIRQVGSFPDLTALDETARKSPNPFPPGFSKSPNQAIELAPYRLWSVKTALPSINLGGNTKLDGRLGENHAHFDSTRKALASQEFGEQLFNRIQWAAEHRVTPTSGHRVVTAFGGVTGGDIVTNPTFIDDPENPAPHIDSIVPTGQQKRINAWKQLAELVPPTLTGHSLGVYKDNQAEGWDGVKEGVHESVHPIQYLSLMMRDRNGAVILENSIHDALQRHLRTDTPPSVIAQLQKTRAKERAFQEKQLRKTKAEVGGGAERFNYRGRYNEGGETKGKESTPKTFEDLLGTKYATHNKFWYDYYHHQPVLRIKDPLETPLEQFEAFKPFADSVALKEVVR